MKLLDSSYDVMTIIDNDGIIRNLNINEYNIVKYQHYNGNRIIYNFSKDAEIVETFNDGIFNIRYKKTKMQVSDYNLICRALITSDEMKSDQPIKDIILNNISKTLQKDFLVDVLKPYYDSIKFTDDSIIVRGRFKVDKNGQAYYLNGKNWSYLCIVATNCKLLEKKIKLELGELKLNWRTMEIYSKVLFLLYPNKHDTVFMNQLPRKLKDEVMNL